MCKDYLKWNKCNYEFIYENGACKNADSFKKLKDYNYQEYLKIKNGYQ